METVSNRSLYSTTKGVDRYFITNGLFVGSESRLRQGKHKIRAMEHSHGVDVFIL